MSGTNRLWKLTAFLAASCLFGLLLSLRRMGVDELAAAAEVGVVDQGARTWEKSCAICHMSGNGPVLLDSLRPMLKSSGRSVVMRYIVESIVRPSLVNRTKGRPMPSLTYLSDADIADVAAYLMSILQRS